MTKVLISVPVDTTIFQVAKMMESGGIGAIIVKDENQTRGIVTDRDFAIKIAVNQFPMSTSVGKVASYPLQTIDSNESILVAAEIMSERKIRKLVVIESRKLVGIITTTDIVKLLAKLVLTKS